MANDTSPHQMSSATEPNRKGDLGARGKGQRLSLRCCGHPMPEPFLGCVLLSQLAAILQRTLPCFGKSYCAHVFGFFQSSSVRVTVAMKLGVRGGDRADGSCKLTGNMKGSLYNPFALGKLLNTSPASCIMGNLTPIPI
ncbi:UNVERIFIED_CONTAM: hypothetical protein K2H54_015236 [Gekko kuhli]